MLLISVSVAGMINVLKGLIRVLINELKVLISVSVAGLISVLIIEFMVVS